MTKVNFFSKTETFARSFHEFDGCLKTELWRSEPHLILVFGARSALSIAGCLSCWDHSYLLYWHAAVSKQRSGATPTAFPSRRLPPGSSCPVCRLILKEIRRPSWIALPY
ncbi:hypothetical protein ILYODFUR_030740 [Ilyodon furcidens]|uniref:Uncharacterized protein n=1 Tax=Ilyodon furcidens TaxID=33524 RepID=A0ABV0TNG9_9TELE